VRAARLLAAITFARRGPRGLPICSAKDKSCLPGIGATTRYAQFKPTGIHGANAKVQARVRRTVRYRFFGAFSARELTSSPLVFGRLGDPARIVLDFLRLWLSAFSIMAVWQARLRLGFWWRGPLGYDAAPASTGALSEVQVLCARQKPFNDRAQTASAISPLPFRGCASARWVDFARRD
jgi:hypothetical protein